MDSRKYRKLLRCFFYPAAVLFMAGALFCGCTAGGGTTAEEGGAKKESPAEESPTESTAPEAPEIKPVTEPEENGPGGNWYPDIIWNGFSPDTGENGPSGGSPREGLSDSRSGSVLQPGDAADEREAAIPRTGAIPEAHTVTVFQEDGSFELVVPEPLKPSERVIWDSCRIDKGQVLLRGHAEGSFTPSNTVMGRDTRFYVVELAPYEDSVEGHDCIASLPKNAKDLSFPLRLSRGSSGDRLYSRFVACIWDQERLIPVSEPVCITNPEEIAPHREAYTEPRSKKGLLVEHAHTDDAFDLGVSNVIVNIPFNSLFGEGIDYGYDGEVYHFDSVVMDIYDSTIAGFSGSGMNVTAVLLNDYNPDMPDFFYPGTVRNQRAHYYHFNVSTPGGYKSVRAVASFLADRYAGTDPQHGRVQNWIIGNEINNQYWNYIGSMDLESYVREIERSFRVFYNAIRSACANDRVFFSIDHNWNREADGVLRYNGREMLGMLADSISRHGNIGWGLAYHPYSVPMTEPEFWNDFRTGDVTFYEDTPVINFANLQLLTDYMQKDSMRDTDGSVRHIILSEAGFTSVLQSGANAEELQAAAFAYAYYLADSDPYIDSFILSRQVDAPSELRQSLGFGLWTTDSQTDRNANPVRKKRIWEVFEKIDRRQDTLEATAFAKNILGIERWSDIIPDFRWKELEQDGN